MMDVLLEAKGETDPARPARVSILAYAGGPIRVPGWSAPVLIDLAGLELPERLPLLADHENKLAAVAGYGVPRVAGGRLLVDGELDRASDAGGRAIGLNRSGVSLSASVGVEPLRIERLARGDKVTANGRSFTSPDGGLVVVRSGRLREVSLTPCGADPAATVSIAARGRGNEVCMAEQVTMTEPEIRANERQRLADIDAACEGFRGDGVDELRAQAIGGELGLDQLKAHLFEHAKRERQLAALRASRPSAPAVHARRPEASTPDVLAAAVLLRCGFSKQAEEAYGASVTGQADAMRLRSLPAIAEAALLAEGRAVPRSTAAMVTAAFSTVSLPIALGDAATKIVLRTYAGTPTSWAGFGNVVDVSDFRTAKIIRPSFAGELTQLAPGGEIEHGTLAESVVDLKADTYAQMLRIDRRDVINDDGAVFDQAAPALARNAVRALADCIWRVILANGGNFFSVANANLGTDPLDVDSLAAGVAAMASQRDAGGRDLDIRPRVLAVPPALETLGRQLLSSESLARYVAETVDNAPMGNPLRNQLELAIEPRLSNTARFSGASATGWYLFASPADAALNVAFLQGQRQPIVETFGPDSSPNVLAFTWRTYFDFGAGLGDYRAAYKSTGAGG